MGLPYFLTPAGILAIAQLKQLPATLHVSLDVEKSTTTIKVNPTNIEVEGTVIPLPPATLLKGDDNRSILIFRGKQWEKWQYFDPESGRLYKPVFVAPGKPPTVEISGIKMHVTENGDPLKDTHQKLRFLKGAKGRVWDTCCGMGYSAIGLAQLPGVSLVVTSEIDPTMLAICQENPWAQPLWHRPDIQVVRANSATLVSMLRDGSLAAVLHDPPRFALAPELYEVVFYRELWRVLRNGGRLYHYTGNPKKHQAKTLPVRTAHRLRQAGFQEVRLCYQGVCARKRL